MTFIDIFEQDLTLEAIYYHDDREIALNEYRCVTELMLCFSLTQKLYIGVDGDSDEIIYLSQVDSKHKYSNLALRHPWINDLYGKKPIFGWEMKNTQGYFDAIQLEFFIPMLGSDVSIQFKAVASSLHLYKVWNIM